MHEAAPKLGILAAIFLVAAFGLFGVAAAIQSSREDFRRIARAEPAVVVGLSTRAVFDGRQGHEQAFAQLRLRGHADVDEVEVGSLRGLREGQAVTAYVHDGPPREVRLLDGFFTGPSAMVFCAFFGGFWAALAVLFGGFALALSVRARRRG